MNPANLFEKPWVVRLPGFLALNGESRKKSPL
jgi:hypothetical protein